MQSVLKQMSRSKPAKGCGVRGHVVGWQGQLIAGPVNSRSRPEGRTVTSTHRSFPGRLSRRRLLTAGAALAGSSAGPAWAAQTSLPAVIHLPNGIRPEGIAIDDLHVPTTVAAYGDRLYLPNARFTTTPTPDTPYDVIAVARRRVETAGR